MLKYLNTDIVFQEVPDETSLAINITGCPCRCPGCHSPYLWADTGRPLDANAIDCLMAEHGKGITCICFMGGDDVEILAVGRMVRVALNASVELAQRGIACGVIDARFIKPMDEAMLREAGEKCRLLVTLEDNVVAGGFGSAVIEKLAAWGLRANVLNLGVPDRFIEQGTVAEQMEECGLTASGVVEAIAARFAAIE